MWSHLQTVDTSPRILELDDAFGTRHSRWEREPVKLFSISG
jgi:hypothetical protein